MQNKSTQLHSKHFHANDHSKCIVCFSYYLHYFTNVLEIVCKPPILYYLCILSRDYYNSFWTQVIKVAILYSKSHTCQVSYQSPLPCVRVYHFIRVYT